MTLINKFEGTTLPPATLNELLGATKEFN